MKRKNPEGSRVAAWLAVITGALAAAATGGVPLIHAITNQGPERLPIEVQAGAILTCITVLLSYTYSRFESLRDEVHQLLEHPTAGTLSYNTTATFLAALAAATVGAEEVSTINASVPRGSLPELDAYFKKVGRHWSSKDAAGASFRSVGYVESEAKAKWLIQRAYEDRQSPSTSYGLIKQRQLGESATLCFHLVRKGNSYWSFLYPSPELSGAMRGVCIMGAPTYEVLHDLFDRIWHQAVPLASGKVLHVQGLDYLVGLAPNLNCDATLNLARKAAVHRALLV